LVSTPPRRRARSRCPRIRADGLPGGTVGDPRLHPELLAIAGDEGDFLLGRSAQLVEPTLVRGLRCIWLPARWKRLELAAPSRQKLVTVLLRRIRWFERFSRPRASRLFGYRVTRSVFGALVFGLTLSAFLAPPFSGLDTLPSLGVVVLGLGVLMRDLLLALLGALLGAIGVATILVIGNLVVETA
jgi:hypothetical protein